MKLTGKAAVKFKLIGTKGCEAYFKVNLWLMYNNITCMLPLCHFVYYITDDQLLLFRVLVDFAMYLHDYMGNGIGHIHCNSCISLLY